MINTHAIAALNSAAQTHVDMLDTFLISPKATDNVGHYIASVQETARDRRNDAFNAAVELADLSEVLDYVYDRADEISALQKIRAIAGAKKQRIMREKRIEAERIAEIAKKRAALAVV